jgi:hypothetical protein
VGTTFTVVMKPARTSTSNAEYAVAVDSIDPVGLRLDHDNGRMTHIN